VGGDEIDMTWEQKVLQKVNETLDTGFGQPQVADGLYYEEYDGSDENGNPFYKKVVNQPLDSTKQYFIHITKRGTRPSVFDTKSSIGHHHAAIDATGRLEFEAFQPLNPKEHLNLVEGNVNDAAGAGVNRQSKKVAELNECNFTVIGDPELRSGRIATILGVGKKYSANYYIIACEHRISSDDGYKCIITSFRNAKNNIGVPSQNVNVDELCIDKNAQIALPADGTERLGKVPVTKD
jgi:hypothetical protein